LVAGCVGQVAVVPEVLPVDELELLPELVPPVLEPEVPELELEPPVPVPVPEPEAPELVPFVVALVDPVPAELVVAPTPEDVLPEEGEPLVDELPVSPPLVEPEPLGEVVEAAPVDDDPESEGSEPPFSSPVTDAPGSVRAVEELSDELDVAGVEVTTPAEPDPRGEREGLLAASWDADLAFACVTRAVPAAVDAAAWALEI